MRGAGQSTRRARARPRRQSVERPTVTEDGLVPLEWVERTILVLRGHRVILDSDLAALYGVTVSVFNQR